MKTQDELQREFYIIIRKLQQTENGRKKLQAMYGAQRPLLG